MKKVWLVIIIILALIGGAIAYVALSDSDTSTFQQETTPANQDNTQPTEPGTTAGDGEYVDYSPEAVANTDGRKWLFFHAPWCPQCRALESDIQSGGVPQGITIFKVDYDSSTELKQKYGVTLQTTVVEIDADGNEIGKTVPYDDPQVSTVVDALGE